jgi:damage-control phosphatase, subfamily I
MNYRPYCIPCFLRRTLHTAELATSDEWLHRKILGEIMAELVRADIEATPAELVQRIFRTTAHTLGLADPYAEEKRRWQEEVLANDAWIRARVDGAADPFAAALDLSIASNQLDNELRPILTLRALVEGLAEAPFEPDALEEFRAAAGAAHRVLFIHDSAGELFFDRLLIEKMGIQPAAVTSAVRKTPTIADATREDAVAAGIDRVTAAIIDPGIDCQGVPLGECSEEFRSHFQAADLVVVKGQAGWQTLDREVSRGTDGKDIFFLLTVKCPVMASALGVGLGSLVLDRA